MEGRGPSAAVNVSYSQRREEALPGRPGRPDPSPSPRACTYSHSEDGRPGRPGRPPPQLLVDKAVQST